MQNSQVISTKELRDNIAEILEKVAIGKQSFIVAKFGRKKALLSPVGEIEAKKERRQELRKLTAFGMWKDRKEIKDSSIWISKLRKQQSLRGGN